MDIPTIMRRQDEILSQIATIRSMKKGSITLGHSGAVKAAASASSSAYPVLTWKEQGRSKGVRLKTRKEVAWAQSAVEQYKRYTALCREYEELAEQLALLQRDAGVTAPSEAEKKGLKSRRSSARK